MLRLPHDCPICGSELTVSELTCPSCRTTIRNSFELPESALLPREAHQFLAAFIRNRGSLEATAAELRVGPAAAARQLDLLVEHFASPRGESEEPALPARLDLRRRNILERLDRGEITAAEATRLLEEMARGR